MADNHNPSLNQIGLSKFNMKNMCLAGVLLISIAVLMSSIPENVFAQTNNPHMSPLQQMQQFNDPAQVVCKEG